LSHKKSHCSQWLFYYRINRYLEKQIVIDQQGSEQ